MDSMFTNMTTNSAFRERITQRIWQAVEDDGVTMVALSEGTHIPRTTLIRSFQGNRALDLDDIGLIARFLRREPAEFFVDERAAA